MRDLSRMIVVVGLAIPAFAAETVPTFAEHIAPIIFQNCTSCHRPGEAGPFPLTNYAEVAKRGKMIAAVTKSRYMPPWHAEKTHYAFANERRLTEAQILQINAWVRAGMPEGSTAKIPALPKFTEGWQLGPPDMILRMAKPYVVPAEGRDIYRYFALPLDIPEDKWVRAIEFRKQRPAVHHALLYIDNTDDWKTDEGADGQPGFKALTGQRAGVGGWAPGADPVVFEMGTAVKFPKDSAFVLQTHFHPTGKVEEEASVIGIYFADKPPTRSRAEIHLPPTFGVGAGINIPAGEPKYTVTESFVTPVDVDASAVHGHAHFLGKEMRMTADLPNGEHRDLLWIKQWNFSWQSTYKFKDRVTLPKGTKVTATISWDNSAANANNQFNPPQRVKWGEATTDEMGSITLDISPVHEEE